MHLSAEDMFCFQQKIPEEAAAETVSANVLDFNKHGDDVSRRLFLCVQVAEAAADAEPEEPELGQDPEEPDHGALLVYWESDNSADFDDDPQVKLLTPVALGADDLAKGAFVVRNLPVPRGLRQFNRLVFVNGESEEFETGPVVNGFLVDGRDEPLD